jgi:hypothetical protein
MLLSPVIFSAPLIISAPLKRLLHLKLQRGGIPQQRRYLAGEHAAIAVA